MNELAEQVQQAYDRGGREAAGQAFVNGAVERKWTRSELDEAVRVLRSVQEEA